MKNRIKLLTLGLMLATSICPFVCQAVSLHQAVQHNKMDAMKALINKGADVNAVNEEGLTPLHCAIEHLNIPAIKILLTNKNIAINAKQPEGTITPIEYAQKKITSLEDLISSASEMIENQWISPEDAAEEILLHKETIKKNQEIVTILFEHGAEFDRILLEDDSFVFAKVFEAECKLNLEKTIQNSTNTRSLNREFNQALQRPDVKTLELFNHHRSNRYGWDDALTKLAFCPKNDVLPVILNKMFMSKLQHYSFIWSNDKSEKNLEETYNLAKQLNNTSLGKAIIGTGVHLRNFQGRRNNKTNIPNEIAYKINSYLPAITHSTYVNDLQKQSLKRKKSNKLIALQNKKKK